VATISPTGQDSPKEKKKLFADDEDEGGGGGSREGGGARAARSDSDDARDDREFVAALDAEDVLINKAVEKAGEAVAKAGEAVAKAAEALAAIQLSFDVLKEAQEAATKMHEAAMMRQEAATKMKEAAKKRAKKREQARIAKVELVQRQAQEAEMKMKREQDRARRHRLVREQARELPKMGPQTIIRCKGSRNPGAWYDARGIWDQPDPKQNKSATVLRGSKFSKEVNFFDGVTASRSTPHQSNQQDAWRSVEENLEDKGDHFELLKNVTFSSWSTAAAVIAGDMRSAGAWRDKDLNWPPKLQVSGRVITWPFVKQG
jgi:hypothetical protein